MDRLKIKRQNFKVDPELEQVPVRPLENRHTVVELVRPAPAKEAAGQATKVIPSSTRPAGGAAATAGASYPVQQVGESPH